MSTEDKIYKLRELLSIVELKILRTGDNEYQKQRFDILEQIRKLEKG